MSRPSLGFEYEVALARIDLSQTLTFAESPYPSIVGSFEVITCTRNVELRPPHLTTKAIPCGYNPAAQVIPATSTLGTLSFSLHDKAEEDQAMAYIGSSCVARVTTRIDESAMRTVYCSYYTPSVTQRAPEGEGVGEVTVDGSFTLLR